ncbi:MAG TPA: hypothetical protein ENG63_09585 [Candidatus Desulfofervidus auxilii]|uniref:histidine kinase n=1 Tax=Desulfofervidus auxilii TaxID=1621989 RepID=A0A7C0YAP7_DESA2|nr:MAG: hypothetical protein DRP58_02600 [Spirochaetota bacterium]HDD45091.1 hypothetical protein [Candidatus Desulfofervidus auxilii]
MSKELIFKPRARLMLQLGEQLIRNESIALLELIKNAYDADASKVKVIMKNIDEPEKGSIIIEDDGSGMTEDIIKNVWMEPGSDYKENLFKKGIKTPKFKRLPLGEKGIGRFAAHKLGELITLITRANNEQEILLKIDWTAFEKNRYLEDVPIKLIKRKPQIFKNGTGTRIEIKKLRRAWTRGMLRDVYRSIQSFTSPFETYDSFQIIFETDHQDWIEDLLTMGDIKDYALFKFKCVIKGNRIEKFYYEFKPWPSMQKVTGRVIDETDQYIKKRLLLVDDSKEINLDKFNIGPVVFEGYIFDLDPKILSLGVPDKKVLKEYLKVNGGIRVYRDGIRVYDYGEPGNDWLNLGIRRVNEPTKRISSNIIVSAVHISREKSTDLIEKTNREGFIENEAFDELKKALLYSLGQIEVLRYEDKEKIRVAYGLKSAKVKEPVVGEILNLKKVIEKSIKEERTKRDIFRYLDRIESRYREMREILLRGAGAGLTLSVVVHEIEKIIGELKRAVKQKTDQKIDIKRIKNLIEHLAKLVEGYSIIIKKSKIETCNLKILINQAIFNMEFRFNVHEIKIHKAYNKKDDISIKCARNLVINSIINILDNSIWWLEYKYKRQKFEKKIFIDISEIIEDYISIVIADNGPGLTLPPEEITKPFVSAKPDGMGLGLHIVDEIMKAHGGFLKFPEADEVDVPEDFKKGFIVLLAFKKEGEK